MSNNYYAPGTITEHTLARASDINSETTSLESAFDKLPTEVLLKEDRVTYQATDTGTANVYAIALTYTISSYTDGLRVRFKPANVNTGACTLNVDSVGAVSIKLQDGTNPAAGDLPSGGVVEVQYDGTNFVLMGSYTSYITSASTSATNAATSETAASTSQTAAATSATNSATSATNSATSATGASTSQTAAATSATNSATSATNSATSATGASTSQTAAATSATNSATSATAASTSATNAATSATSAAASKTAAAASETAAAASETASASSETASASSETAAATSATNAATSYDSFDDRYLGAKSSDPSLDNDGDALLDGVLYWNTTSNSMFVYDLGNTTFVTVSNTASSTSAANSATASASSATSAATSATNSATSATNSATSATNSATSETNSATSATNAATSETSAAAILDAFDDRYLGSKASDPTLDNDGNALVDGALYFNTTNNIMKVYDLGATSWLRMTPTTTEQTNINTVSGISANVTTVAGISAAVTTVAGNSADVSTVAGVSTNVANVGNDIANVNSVASNIASVNNFALTYRTGATDPTTSLDDGDLFYNTTSNQLKVYNGSAWEAGVLAGAVALIKANNLSDLASKTTAQQNLGRWYSQTISTDRTVAANSDFLTGADLVINNGVTLTIPATSALEISMYATGEVL